ncbi:DUF4270 family protein [Mucilaginibacter auburnensis]|uniref:Uncharacterized protein DUF4270 n=1 Tax=Mucilaginibacter auburnensis TaxID=1457233 RepID=A0A2H9VSA0_9SPHI|nr:DUF4270 family protein [Mucilaginibacter auburnensis]PJJ83669.1 uncharacterized protein DUF4270 [Mucilaginibacter auburnensis]
MKFFRLDLLTLLISLFILSSCKKQGTVNLGVNDGNLIEGSLIDTSTVYVNTVPEEDAIASGLAKTALSYFKDPVFGITESNIAMDLNLPSQAAYTVPTGTIAIDSAILILPYTSGFYGDSLTTRFKANVYQLDERILSNGTYNASKKWKTKSVLLGTKSFFPRTRDSVRVIQPIRAGKDSLMKFIPQVRVPLDPTFVNSILFNAPADQVASNLVFRNRVNGLYVTLDKNQTGPGGTMMFNMDSATVKVYVKVTATDGSTIDTNVVVLPSVRRSAEISHNYAGTAIATELAATTSKTRNTFYLQGLLGLRAKVQFPYLKEIITKAGSDIIVNRAELVISPQPGTAFPYTPINSLMLYKLDLAKQRINIQDNTQTDPRSATSYGGFYNSDKKEYRFLVTAYVQDLMRGKTIDYGTYIGAADNQGFSYFSDVTPNPQLDGRTAAVGSDGSTYRVKLNIIYTKVNK